jgi:hypothetical protein
VALEMAARLPHARARTIEGATHGLLRSHAQPLAGAMARFLGGL